MSLELCKVDDHISLKEQGVNYVPKTILASCRTITTDGEQENLSPCEMSQDQIISDVNMIIQPSGTSQMDLSNVLKQKNEGENVISSCDENLIVKQGIAGVVPSHKEFVYSSVNEVSQADNCVGSCEAQSLIKPASLSGKNEDDANPLQSSIDCEDGQLDGKGFGNNAVATIMNSKLREGDELLSGSKKRDCPQSNVFTTKKLKKNPILESSKSKTFLISWKKRRKRHAFTGQGSVRMRLPSESKLWKQKACDISPECKGLYKDHFTWFRKLCSPAVVTMSFEKYKNLVQVESLVAIVFNKFGGSNCELSLSDICENLQPCVCGTRWELYQYLSLSPLYTNGKQHNSVKKAHGIKLSGSDNERHWQGILYMRKGWTKLRACREERLKCIQLFLSTLKPKSVSMVVKSLCKELRIPLCFEMFHSVTNLLKRLAASGNVEKISCVRQDKKNRCRSEEMDEELVDIGAEMVNSCPPKDGSLVSGPSENLDCHANLSTIDISLLKSLVKQISQSDSEKLVESNEPMKIKAKTATVPNSTSTSLDQYDSEKLVESNKPKKIKVQNVTVPNGTSTSLDQSKSSLQISSSTPSGLKILQPDLSSAQSGLKTPHPNINSTPKRLENSQQVLDSVPSCSGLQQNHLVSPAQGMKISSPNSEPENKEKKSCSGLQQGFGHDVRSILQSFTSNSLQNIQPIKEENKKSSHKKPRAPRPPRKTGDLFLPLSKGWVREVVQRGLQVSARADVYYHPPVGKKLRSMIEIGKHLTKENIQDLTLENFSFNRDPVGYGAPYELVRTAKYVPGLFTKKDPKVEESVDSTINNVSSITPPNDRASTDSTSVVRAKSSVQSLSKNKKPIQTKSKAKYKMKCLFKCGIPKDTVDDFEIDITNEVGETTGFEDWSWNAGVKKHNPTSKDGNGVPMRIPIGNHNPKDQSKNFMNKTVPIKISDRFDVVQEDDSFLKINSVCSIPPTNQTNNLTTYTADKHHPLFDSPQIYFSNCLDQLENKLEYLMKTVPNKSAIVASTSTASLIQSNTTTHNMNQTAATTINVKRLTPTSIKEKPITIRPVYIRPLTTTSVNLMQTTNGPVYVTPSSTLVNVRQTITTPIVTKQTPTSLNNEKPTTRAPFVLNNETPTTLAPFVLNTEKPTTSSPFVLNYFKSGFALKSTNPLSIEEQKITLKSEPNPTSNSKPNPTLKGKVKPSPAKNSWIDIIEKFETRIDRHGKMNLVDYQFKGVIESLSLWPDQESFSLKIPGEKCNKEATIASNLQTKKSTNQAKSLPLTSKQSLQKLKKNIPQSTSSFPTNSSQQSLSGVQIEPLQRISSSQTDPSQSSPVLETVSSKKPPAKSKGSSPGKKKKSIIRVRNFSELAASKDDDSGNSLHQLQINSVQQSNLNNSMPVLKIGIPSSIHSDLIDYDSSSSLQKAIPVSVQSNSSNSGTTSNIAIIKPNFSIKENSSKDILIISNLNTNAGNIVNPKLKVYIPKKYIGNKAPDKYLSINSNLEGDIPTLHIPESSNPVTPQFTVLSHQLQNQQQLNAPPISINGSALNQPTAGTIFSANNATVLTQPTAGSIFPNDGDVLNQPTAGLILPTNAITTLNQPTAGTILPSISVSGLNQPTAGTILPSIVVNDLNQPSAGTILPSNAVSDVNQQTAGTILSSNAVSGLNQPEAGTILPSNAVSGLNQSTAGALLPSNAVSALSQPMADTMLSSNAVNLLDQPTITTILPSEGRIVSQPCTALPHDGSTSNQPSTCTIFPAGNASITPDDNLDINDIAPGFYRER